MPHPSGRPWVIAHRGASRVARENTLDAFRRAIELGADAVELDVRRTNDGHLIVHHDDTLIGADRPIIAMTRTQVARTDPDVPDLADALAACHPLWVDVEIKNDPRDADHDPDRSVAETICSEYATADILVTSFDPVTVAIVRERGLRTGWLLGRGTDLMGALPEAVRINHQFLLPHWSQVNDVEGAHITSTAGTSGIEVAVWTVDDPDQIRRLADLGVGGICTNVPDIARSALDDGHSDGG